MATRKSKFEPYTAKKQNATESDTKNGKNRKSKPKRHGTIGIRNTGKYILGNGI